MTASFQTFIEEHKDEITALQILYNRPYAERGCFKDIKELAAAIAAPPLSLSVDGLWQAYAQLDKSRVRGSGPRVLTDLVSLVKFAIKQDDELAPFRDKVNERFDAWLAGQESNGRTFTVEQRRWLLLIRDHIAGSYAIEREDFDDVPFSQHGGLGKLYEVFGDDYKGILTDLNEALVGMSISTCPITSIAKVIHRGMAVGRQKTTMMSYYVDNALVIIERQTTRSSIQIASSIG